MFGAVCSGRPIQLAEQVEPNKFVFAIPDAANINYVAIFLLPQSNFTDVNYTALVYFQLPNATEFKLLGGLNPAKPSAIFRLNTKTQTAGSHSVEDDDAMNDADAVPASGTSILNVGISIEPTPQAELLLQQEKLKQRAIMPLPAPQPAPQSTLDIASLANKIVRHAYNYLSGFIDALGKVPMKAFDTWWEKFRMKLANNPNFLNEID